MLDLDWERSIPIIDVKLDELNSIFSEYDKEIIITDFSAIQLGCRNSNFVVNTNKGKYLLRLANISDLNNEIIAYELVKDKINVPKLLFHITKNKAKILYINTLADGHVKFYLKSEFMKLADKYEFQLTVWKNF